MKIPDHIETTKGFMMNGDSSSPNVELIYEMRASRRMVDKGVQFTPECLSVDETVCATAETRPIQELNHTISTPRRNIPLRRTTEQEEAIESAEETLETVQPTTKATVADEEKLESASDKVDGVWRPENVGEEDEGCGMKCLYIAVQCCECVIL